MQQIINALLRNVSLVLYLALLSFALIFLSNRSYYHQSQLYRLGMGLGGWINQGRTSFTNYFEISNHNNILKRENDHLINQLLKPKDSLNLSSENYLGYRAIPADLIQKSYHLPKNTFILNRGSKAGITKEMGVIGAHGIVGIVNQVTPNFSSVMSLLDTDLSINAAFKKNGAFGSLQWTGKAPQEFDFRDISIINPVRIGDTIVTGGMSAYFPKGIPLGQVIEYDSDRVQGYHQIKVKLFHNPTQLHQVYVLENYGREELDSLKQLLQ